MARYLISFDAHAMDHIPPEDMPAVDEAAHEVVREALNAGVWVFGGGLEHEKATVVSIDGTVSEGRYPEAIGGLCVVDVPSREEALEWAAKTAAACRCAQKSARSCPTRPWGTDRGKSAHAPRGYATGGRGARRVSATSASSARGLVSRRTRIRGSSYRLSVGRAQPGTTVVEPM